MLEEPRSDMEWAALGLGGDKAMLAVKITADKYGKAIALLLDMGGGFQTRFENTLIVNAAQRRALEQAGFVAANGSGPKRRQARGETAK